MSSAPPDSSTATPDYHRPRVLHVPAEKGVVKWMSGDVYETMATADSTNGALGASGRRTDSACAQEC
jgi:hypothetical protein